MIITKYDILIEKCREELRQRTAPNTTETEDAAFERKVEKLAEERFKEYYQDPLFKTAFPPIAVLKTRNRFVNFTFAI